MKVYNIIFYSLYSVVVKRDLNFDAIRVLLSLDFLIGFSLCLICMGLLTLFKYYGFLLFATFLLAIPLLLFHHSYFTKERAIEIFKYYKNFNQFKFKIIGVFILMSPFISFIIFLALYKYGIDH